MKRLLTLWFIIISIMGLSAPVMAANLADLAGHVPVYQLKKYDRNAFAFRYTPTGHQVVIDGHKKTYDAPNHFVIRNANGYIMVDKYGDKERFLSMIVTSEKSPVAYLVGRLGDTFPHAIEALLKDYPNVKILMPQNIPGGYNVGAIVKGMHMIYDAGLTTILTDEFRVASAGSAVFMAGKYRYAMSDAKIGIHNFGGIESDEELSDTVALRKFYKKAGIADDFYDFMRSKPNADMYWLNADELKQYNIVNTTPAEIERMLKINMTPLDKPIPIEEYKFFSQARHICPKPSTRVLDIRFALCFGHI